MASSTATPGTPSTPSEGSVRKMFVGKNVHFSPADGKPLCSFSQKLCKQRRLNGFAFCIRHVLEDPNCGFKQCDYVAKYNGNRCTNPIPEKEDRIFCNSHLQVMGVLPKKSRKKKSVDPPVAQTPAPSKASLPLPRRGPTPLQPAPMPRLSQSNASRPYSALSVDERLAPAKRPMRRDVRPCPAIPIVPNANFKQLRSRQPASSNAHVQHSKELLDKLRDVRTVGGYDDLLNFGFAVSDEEDVRDSDHDERLQVYSDLRSCLRSAAVSLALSSDGEPDDTLNDRHCNANATEEDQATPVDVVNEDQPDLSDDGRAEFRKRCLRKRLSLRKELRRLRHIEHVRRTTGSKKDQVVRALIATVRTSSRSAFEVLKSKKRAWNSLKRRRNAAFKKKHHCAALTASGRYCIGDAVPFSRYCPLHIPSDRRQVLFAEGVDFQQTRWPEAFVECAPSLQSLLAPPVDHVLSLAKAGDDRRHIGILPDTRRGPAPKGRMVPVQPRVDKLAPARGGRGARGAHSQMLAGARHPAQLAPALAPVGRGAANPRQRRGAPMPRGRGGRRGGRLPPAPPPHSALTNSAAPSTKPAGRIPKLVLKLPPRPIMPASSGSGSGSSSGTSSSGSGSESDSESNSASGSGSSSSYSDSDMDTSQPSFGFSQDRTPAHRQAGDKAYLGNNQLSFYPEPGNSMWSPVSSSPMNPPSLRSPVLTSDRTLLSSPLVSPASQLQVDFPESHDQSELMSPHSSFSNTIGSSPYLNSMMPQPPGPVPLSPSFERSPSAFGSSHSFQH